MAWFKVDDQLAFHPKVVQAGNAAIGLWVRCGSYSAQFLTDGWLSLDTVRALGGHKRDIDRLVQVGLWRHDGDGIRFHDWEDFQPTKAQVEAEREATRERVERWRNKNRNAEGNAVTNGNGTDAPSRPDPTHISTSKDVDRKRARNHKLPKTWKPTPEHSTRAEETGLNLERETIKFRAHAEEKGRTAKNWNAAFTRWLINAAEYAERDNTTPLSAADQRAYREWGKTPPRPNRVQQNLAVVEQLWAQENQTNDHRKEIGQ